jgi:hypothetical protein
MQTAKLCSDWLFFEVFDNWITRLGETVVSGGTYLNMCHVDFLPEPSHDIVALAI